MSHEKIREHSINRLLSIFEESGVDPRHLPEISTPVRPKFRPEAVLQQALLEPYDFSVDNLLVTGSRPRKFIDNTAKLSDSAAELKPEKTNRILIKEETKRKTHALQKLVLQKPVQQTALPPDVSLENLSNCVPKEDIIGTMNTLAAKNSAPERRRGASSTEFKNVETKAVPWHEGKSVAVKSKKETANSLTTLSVSPPISKINTTEPAQKKIRQSRKGEANPAAPKIIPSKAEQKLRTVEEPILTHKKGIIEPPPERMPGQLRSQPWVNSCMHESDQVSQPASVLRNNSQHKNRNQSAKARSRQLTNARRSAAALYTRLLRQCAGGDDPLNILRWRARLQVKGDISTSRLPYPRD